MSTYRLPDNVHFGAVRLRVADLDRSLEFYVDTLGFRPVHQEAGEAPLAGEGEPERPGAGEDAASETPEARQAARSTAREASLSATGELPAQVHLVERPGARPRPRGTAGLYHFAVLVPSRKDLARVLVHLRERGWPLQGASDHAVSEALYLADPDGNGIEIYVDRPRESWPRQDGEIAMTTLPIDLRGLLAELPAEPEPWSGLAAGTTIGHIHLHEPSLAAAERFYHATLGFDVVTRRYPGALFLAAGGYHHHVGTNIWAGEGAPPTPEDAAGLVDYELVVPDAADRTRLLDHLRETGVEPVQTPAGFRVRDPAGVDVVIRG